MRANPELLSGLNVYWVKFFLLAVFATMYVRDHARPAFHKAIGFEPTDFDMKVLRLTSEISRQVFPLTLDLDNPKFQQGLERLSEIARASAAAKARGGLFGKATQAVCAARAGPGFARLYLMPAKANALPSVVRLAPI